MKTDAFGSGYEISSYDMHDENTVDDDSDPDYQDQCDSGEYSSYLHFQPFFWWSLIFRLH